MAVTDAGIQSPLVVGAEPSAGGRSPDRPGWLHRVRRVLLVAAVAMLVPAGASYVQAMLGRSNASLGIRSVEWLRDHGAAGLVSQIESTYYTLTAPSKGGPGLRALPQVGFAAAPPSSPGPARHNVRRYRPPNIRPALHPAFAGEGVWHPARPGEGANAPVLLTTLRSEPDYPRLVAGVAWIDTSRSTVALQPGLSEPAVSGIPRGGAEIPLPARHDLLASFNSGFKLKDAAAGSGVVLGGHTYAPMEKGVATLLRGADGHVDVRAWSGGPVAPAGTAFARQNLPLIVSGGHRNPNLSDGPEWGFTLHNAVRVWRSGVGVDRRGNLLYAAASDQTVGSLADILIRAGAVRAMELDINSYWVSFITYAGLGGSSPRNLLSGMNRSPQRYLSPDDRDFFYVYAGAPAALRREQRRRAAAAVAGRATAPGVLAP